MNFTRSFFAILVVLTSYCSASPRIVLTSIPKCGTHMLTKCVHLLTGKQGKRYPHHQPPLNLEQYNDENLFYYNHFYTTPENLGFFGSDAFAGVFIYRDPRDALISLIFYVQANAGNGRFDAKYNGMSFDAMFEELILTGQHNSFYLPDHWRMYMRWMDQRNFISIRYEDLVGPRGGGSYQAQLDAIMHIAQHLSLTISQEKMHHVAQSLFGNSKPSGGELETFSKGQIGRWHEYFDEAKKAFFKEHFGQLLIELGYEQDLNW